MRERNRLFEFTKAMHSTIIIVIESLAMKNNVNA